MSKFNGLKPAQQQAIMLLTQSIIDPDGEHMTYGQISEACGIDQSTLFRWRTYDADFIAARKELVERYTDELVEDAFTALKYQLRHKKSVKASEVVLRSRGMLIDRREGAPDTVVNVGIEETDNAALADELAELRSRLERNDP